MRAKSVKEDFAGQHIYVTLGYGLRGNEVQVCNITYQVLMKCGGTNKYVRPGRASCWV